MNSEIKYVKGNMFTSKCQTLVNTVNCVGVMGAGIALEFKYRYPDMFKKYVEYCRQNLIEIGKLWIYDIPNQNKKVLNFPTKKDWKFPSKYEYLEKGLKRFVETYQEKAISSIAFPLLGAQNGGLDPEVVKNLMYNYLDQCNIPIEIYEFDSFAEDDLLANLCYGLTYELKEFERLTGLKKNSIHKIKQVLEENSIPSLISLNKRKGIGEETIKACYQFAMLYNRRPVSSPQNIFKTDQINEVDRTKNEVTKQVDKPNLIFYELIEKENNSTVEEQCLNIEEKKLTKSNKKRSTKKKKVEDLLLEEKILLTGLSEKIITKIESKDESVTIQDVRQYCNNLKINFRTFFGKQYFPSKKTTS